MSHGAAATPNSSAAEALSGELQNLDLSVSGQPPSSQPSTDAAQPGLPTLSQRGRKNAAFLSPAVEKIVEVFKDLYDPETNPDGVVNLGVADNSLCRKELLQYFNKHRLNLSAGELTYADRFTSSYRLLVALSDLFNTKTPDFPEASRSPLPLKPVTPEHIAISSGATGVLDQLFWALCEPGEGVLLSTPYYNGFDHDLTARAATTIVPVDLPHPKQPGRSADLELDAGSMFTADTVQLYEKALLDAEERGVKVKALLLCNPHNPLGTIYPRETVVALARLAAKYKLHFISDEIYARSCYATTDDGTSSVGGGEVFHSVLSIDTRAEAGLDPAYVHVVTSASKDFAINGFRLGVLVSQHNRDLHRAMTGVGMLAQSASPAGALWYTWLEDQPFLAWYLEENRRRMAAAYRYVTRFLQHHRIPYAKAQSGHFLLIDLGRFCAPSGSDAGVEAGTDEKRGREAEAQLVARLLGNKVYVAPGTMYHHPVPGWFRLTFTQAPMALRVGLGRLEKALGLEDRFEEGRPVLDLESGGKEWTGSGGQNA